MDNNSNLSRATINGSYLEKKREEHNEKVRSEKQARYERLEEIDKKLRVYRSICQLSKSVIPKPKKRFYKRFFCPECNARIKFFKFKSYRVFECDCGYKYCKRVWWSE